MCDEGQVYMMAGVVTDPEQSAFHASISVRSYIELDGQEFLVERSGGARATNSVLWLERAIDGVALRKLLTASKLDTWTAGGGAIRSISFLYVKTCGNT